MNKHLSLLFVASVFFLASCRQKGINIYESDPTSALTEKINSQLKPDMKITNIRLDQAPSKAPFTDIMGSATVESLDSKNLTTGIDINLVDGKTKDVSASYNIKNKAQQLFNDTLVGNTTESWGTVNDIDYSNIKSNLEKAGRMITSEGFENAGTDHYTIRLSEDKDKVVHEFTLNAKNKNATSLQGKRIVTNYFQIDFEADHNGNVKMLDSK